jgi:hypothetical protein
VAIPAPDFHRLFTLGSVYTHPQGHTATVAKLETSKLVMPTGQLAACDPFVYLPDEATAFRAAVLPGTYTVVVSVVEIVHRDVPATGEPHYRVAAAKVQVADKEAASWELALTGDQDLSDLGPDEFFGYGVDAGTGCFVDASAAASFGEFVGGDGDVLLDAFYGQASGNPLVVTLTDPSSQATLVAFASGWGDGAYPTWVGRDDDGQITAFVTDFQVVAGANETE